jgi:zinc-dependent metalloproteinase lipoprotein
LFCTFYFNYKNLKKGIIIFYRLITTNFVANFLKMKKVLLTTILLCAGLLVFSQRNINTLPKQKSNKIRCYTVEALKKQRQLNPNLETDEQFETWIAQKTAERKSSAAARGENVETITNYYLPIVFHIIHSGQPVGSGTNLSQALINSQVAQLNKDFGNFSGSPYAAASTTGIKFGLATTNPSGGTMAEPGIDRIYYVNKGWTAPPYDGSDAYFEGTIKPNSIWDPTKYVNVWVCDQSASGLLGIATFPASSTLQGLDNAETNTTAGVVVEVTSVGSKFTSPDCGITNSYDMGRTLTHELGHFFGLRHIWGDATSCGTATDYCNDTPVALYENYGKPAHPKPNSCGTADEMFENYMDYTDDQLLNTFTLNQTDRIQTVMLNSPRRVSLATSTVGKTLPTSNIVGFDNCVGIFSVSEKGTTGTTNRYTDINIPISVEGAATGNATLTFSVSAITGTGAPTLAVAGVDYQILNSTLDFVSTDATKNYVLRILDNAKIDGQRGFKLTYSISGSGVTAGTKAQILNVYINDDDDIIVGQNTINMLNESFTAGTMPSGWNTFKSSAYLSQWVIGSNGDAGGSAPNAYISSDATAKPNTYTGLPSGQTFVGAVLETPLIEAYRVQSLGNLNFKFKVKGRTYSSTSGTGHYGALYFTSADDPNNNYNQYGTTSGNTGYGPWANSTTTQVGSPSIASSFLNNARYYIDFYWAVSTTSTANNPGLNIDDVVLTATPWNVESTVSNSYTFNTQSSATHMFRSSVNNKAIARVAAQSINVNNVVASITEAGTDRPTFTTGSTTYLRSRKVVKVVPAVTDNTTTHTITIYFTQAEIAAWGTGSSTAKMMKVMDGVNITSGNLNSSNSIIAATTVTDKLTTDGYIAYTATFTGFGQYVIVEQAAILPLQWGTFTGSLENNAVALKWTTYNEINNKEFEVQRSTNASEFISIGTVKALNKSENNYLFNDGKIAVGNRYSYRLKQIDLDGKSSFSNIVNINYFNKDKSVLLYPNPLESKLNIQLNNFNNNKFEIEINDVLGKKMYQNLNIQTNTIEVNTASWTKGVYFVQIKSSNGIELFKVIKN